jgi:hypothetical protein
MAIFIIVFGVMHGHEGNFRPIQPKPRSRIPASGIFDATVDFLSEVSVIGASQDDPPAQASSR